MMDNAKLSPRGPMADPFLPEEKVGQAPPYRARFACAEQSQFAREACGCRLGIRGQKCQTNPIWIPAQAPRTER
jgi:hypothetical protein